VFVKVIAVVDLMPSVLDVGGMANVGIEIKIHICESRIISGIFIAILKIFINFVEK
jgi:hypothetical protein